MRNHNYQKLGYLIIYASEEFSSISPSNVDNLHIEGIYAGYLGAAKGIIVYQCSKCGKIKLSNGVLEKL